MPRYFRPFAAVALLLCLSQGAAPMRGDLVPYVDEAAYLDALNALGRPAVVEGFEDEAAWGGVRTTIVDGPMTAPSISNLGVTWTANNAISGVTTGQGPARSGLWGFFTLPHGDFAMGVTDGFVGTSDPMLIGIGGYIETNTPPAELALFIGPNAQVMVDFGDDPLGNPNSVLSTQHKFFGVIDSAGFNRFEFRELEGVLEDQKLIFADDFTFAFVPEPSTLLLLALPLAAVIVRRARTAHHGRRSATRIGASGAASGAMLSADVSTRCSL